MLDIRRIRTEPDAVIAAVARRGDPALEGEVRRAAALDERLRAIVAERDDIRSTINDLSKQVGQLRREGNTTDAERVQDDSRALGERERALASEHDAVSSELRETLLGIPNLPADEAPDGGGPDDNVVLKTVGYDPNSYGEHQRVPHWDILSSTVGSEAWNSRDLKSRPH